MQPLEIPVIRQAGTPDELVGNIRSALGRGLPEIQPAICAHDGTFVVAGSGPSLPRFVEQIAEERAKGRPIVACNGAHDFLCENLLPPDLFVSIDPRDTIIANTKRKNDRTVYLLASRCSPGLFDHLAGHKALVWHAWSTEDYEMQPLKGKFAIGGGTTSGMRAIQIGYVLGFRKFSIYGLDSCLDSDGATKRFSGEKSGRTISVIVGEAGRAFICNMAMAQQAKEAQNLCAIMPDATFQFHGDGLLAAIWEERRRRGLS